MAIYAYYRVSTNTQMEKNGLEMQVEEIRKYCAKNNITLSGEFHDDGISGTKEDRDGLIDLIASMDKGDKVIVQNTSRLWRDDNVKVFVHRELRRLKADIISVEQPNYTIYEKDPSNYLFNSIMEAFDVYEKMSITMKLSKGRRARAKTGNKPCGVAPIGYKWNGNHIEIDVDSANIVRDIFEFYLETNSLSEVQRMCHQHGYKTQRGKDFSVMAIKNILRNDFYIGILTYAGQKIYGKHEGIISEQVFNIINNGV